MPNQQGRAGQGLEPRVSDASPWLPDHRQPCLLQSETVIMTPSTKPHHVPNGEPPWLQNLSTALHFIGKMTVAQKVKSLDGESAANR